MEIPPVRYAWRGATSLAYQVVGDGPLDIVYVQGYLSNIELNWEHPGAARFLRELASGHRLIIADRRGLGLSERFTPTDTPPTEVLTEDIAAVLDAAGCDRPVIFATGDCGWMALLYAATHAAHVGGLILYGTAATWRWTEDTPWGASDEQLLASSAWVRSPRGRAMDGQGEPVHRQERPGNRLGGTARTAQPDAWLGAHGIIAIRPGRRAWHPVIYPDTGPRPSPDRRPRSRHL